MLLISFKFFVVLTKNLDFKVIDSSVYSLKLYRTIISNHCNIGEKGFAAVPVDTLLTFVWITYFQWIWN